MSYVSELDMVRTSADKVTAKPVTNKQRSKAARQTEQFKDKMSRNNVSIEYVFAACRLRHTTAMERLASAREIEESREMYLRQSKNWMAMYREIIEKYLNREDPHYLGSNVMNLPN